MRVQGFVLVEGQHNPTKDQQEAKSEGETENEAPKEPGERNPNDLALNNGVKVETRSVAKGKFQQTSNEQDK